MVNSLTCHWLIVALSSQSVSVVNPSPSAYRQMFPLSLVVVNSGHVVPGSDREWITGWLCLVPSGSHVALLSRLTWIAWLAFIIPFG